MKFDEYVDAIRVEGAELVRAAGAAGIDARVPSCPAWSVADLLGHVGSLHRRVADLVAERATRWDPGWTGAEPPAAADRLAWVGEGVPMLADALTDAGPAVTLYSWTSDPTSGFWARRQAHETAMHRVDAQLAAEGIAAGTVAPVAHALAVDGIQELLDLVPYWSHADRVRGAGETLHFHATDGPGEWLVTLGADGLLVTHEHAKGDVAARGTASVLLLFLYGRAGADRLEVFGDASLLTRWRELVSW